MKPTWGRVWSRREKNGIRNNCIENPTWRSKENRRGHEVSYNEEIRRGWESWRRSCHTKSQNRQAQQESWRDRNIHISCREWREALYIARKEEWRK